MGFVKLQFGCLLVILYIVITYLKAILKRKIVLSREFNLLMFVAPIAVLFDGITAWTVNHMNIVPELHDIGKIATPDSILQKPGKLSNEEYEIMKEHATQGGKIIRQIFYNLDDMQFRNIAYEIARFHHEKYNGKGYPDGLAGEQIPLHARIMAIADVFDAVSQKRCYRDAMTIDESFFIIEKGIGTDFDPHLAQIFLDNKDEVIKLMKQLED